jgi:hypothetical protein
MPLSTFDAHGQRKYLTRSEADRFLLVSKKETMDVHLFCWFIVATGCRISEALMITARSIDFETRLVIVECLKKRRTGVYRAVPLPATLLKALDRLIRQGKMEDGQRLWPWSRMTGYRRIIEVMKKAGISGPWATPKGLRHAFGVRAVQSGAPLHMVQRWLGHADMKTTAIYANAVGPEEREIASRTWLKQDAKDDRLAVDALEISPPGSDRPDSDRVVPAALTPAPPPSPSFAPIEEQRPWFKRLFFREEIVSTYQTMQFYLFGNRAYDEIS